MTVWLVQVQDGFLPYPNAEQPLSAARSSLIRAIRIQTPAVLQPPLLIPLRRGALPIVQQAIFADMMKMNPV